MFTFSGLFLVIWKLNTFNKIVIMQPIPMKRIAPNGNALALRKAEDRKADN